MAMIFDGIGEGETELLYPAGPAFGLHKTPENGMVDLRHVRLALDSVRMQPYLYLARGD